MNNRRETTRVAYHHPITLYRGSEQILGEINNISLKGIYVKITEADAFRAGEQLKFEIVLPTITMKTSITGNVLVVRQDHQQGVGLCILKMWDDDLGTLRRLIEINLGDADQVGRELKNFITNNDKEKDKK
jgi:hypothetical protein